MINDHDNPDYAAALRKRAEEETNASENAINGALTLSPEETNRVLHELRVHQIELEMQNEELRRTQVELDIARARYFDLFDLAPVGYLTLNEKGMILEANLTASTLLGLPRGELQNKPLSRFICAEMQDSYYKFFRTLIDSGTPQACELRLKKDAPLWVTLEAAAAQTRESGPEYQIIMVDITMRKLAEDDLAAANKDLEAFGYSVAHDLRNPLHSIIACRAVIAKDPETVLGHASLKALEYIQHDSHRMTEIVSDLFSFSKIQKQQIKRTEVDLSALAHDIWTVLASSNPDRSADFIIEPHIIAHSDAGLIQLLLENLVRNAWKFTSKKERARVEFGTIRDSGKTVYFIRDNGAGFDMTKVHKLFRPFQRLHNKNDFDGTGVGLAIVNRIVEKHNGTIWAEGEPDKGATFFFTLDIESRRLTNGSALSACVPLSAIILTVDPEKVAQLKNPRDAALDT